MKKIITDIERESGFVARDPEFLPETTELDQYLEHVTQFLNTGEFVGVNYEDRVEFLKANGYAVTRANLIDSSLSVKPPKEK